MLLTVNGRIGQGSPLSSDALNFFLKRLDHTIASVCGQMKATPTRNADDIVISVNQRSSVEALGNVVETQIEREGLKVNQNKKRDHGIQPNHREQRVHNTVVNSKEGLRMGAEQRQKSTELGESYIRSARAISPDSLQAIAKKRQRLIGWISVASQLRFSPVRHLRRLAGVGDRIVLERLRRENLLPISNRWWLQSRQWDEPERLARLWKEKMQVS
jgi:hypothetical protein